MEFLLESAHANSNLFGGSNFKLVYLRFTQSWGCSWDRWLNLTSVKLTNRDFSSSCQMMSCDILPLLAFNELATLRECTGILAPRFLIFFHIYFNTEVYILYKYTVCIILLICSPQYNTIWIVGRGFRVEQEKQLILCSIRSKYFFQESPRLHRGGVVFAKAEL